MSKLQRKRKKRWAEIKVMEDERKRQRRRLKRNVEKIMKQFLPDVDLKLDDKTKKGKNVKPIWAFTEEEMAKEKEKKEEGIIQFMDDLDYDQMVDDIEVTNLKNSIICTKMSKSYKIQEY